MLFCFLISSVAFAKPVNNWLYVGSTNTDDLYVDTVDLFSRDGVIFTMFYKVIPKNTPIEKSANYPINNVMIDAKEHVAVFPVGKDKLSPPEPLAPSSLLYKAFVMAKMVTELRSAHIDKFYQ
jgi:hypothetical protein